MAKINLSNLILDAAAKTVTLDELSKSGVNRMVNFYEGDVIQFPELDEMRFASVSVTFHNNVFNVYQVGCAVNVVVKWVPIGSFRKKPFLDYAEWIHQNGMELNRQLCEAGNDRKLVELLAGKTITIKTRIPGKTVASWITGPDGRRMPEKSSDGQYLITEKLFPVWSFVD